MSVPTHQYVYRAKHERTVDGDTIYVVVDLGMRVQTTVSIRIKDVNCPELFSGTEREAGAAARDYTEEWMRNATRKDDTGWPLLIETFRDRQSFTRYVGIVWRAEDGRNLADDLVSNGHAQRV